jgi:SAM-dependent methyltransferase
VLSPDASFVSKLRRVRYSIASTGLRRGLSDVMTWLLAYDPESDGGFDRRFGTDTGGRVEPARLGIDDDTVRERAIVYLPSPERVTRWMLGHAGVQHREYTFVDLGCGKGRVLLVASTFPFQAIVGVEVSGALSAIARENIARFQPTNRKCRDVRVETIDATRFEFPNTNLLVHLYHPFEPVVTSAVLTTLERSLASSPRKVVITYLLYTSAAEAVDAEFSRCSWLQRVRHEQSVLGHYDWLLYAN